MKNLKNVLIKLSICSVLTWVVMIVLIDMYVVFLDVMGNEQKAFDISKKMLQLF